MPVILGIPITGESVLIVCSIHADLLTSRWTCCPCGGEWGTTGAAGSPVQESRGPGYVQIDPISRPRGAGVSWLHF